MGVPSFTRWIEDANPAERKCGRGCRHRRVVVGSVCCLQSAPRCLWLPSCSTCLLGGRVRRLCRQDDAATGRASESLSDWFSKRFSPLANPTKVAERSPAPTAPAYPPLTTAKDAHCPLLGTTMCNCAQPGTTSLHQAHTCPARASQKHRELRGDRATPPARSLAVFGLFLLASPS